jgi:hypothetical protein
VPPEPVQSAVVVHNRTVYGVPPLAEQPVGASSRHDEAAVHVAVSSDEAQFGGEPAPVSVNFPQQTSPPEHWPVTPESGRLVEPAQLIE